MSSRVSKSWIYVLNNPTEADESAIRAWDVTRQIYGRERGASGTPHLQGFAVFKTAKRLRGLKKLLPRAHWEVLRGSADAAWDYCAKDGDTYSVDNRLGRGRRTDWADVHARLQAGASALDILREHPHVYVSHSRGIDRAISLLRVARQSMTKCMWCFGGTGTGKSTWVKQQYPSADWCYFNKSGFIFNYRNSGVCVFDDPNLDYISRECFLQLINHTPVNLDVKGGDVPFTSSLVIIVANYDPRVSYHPGDLAVQRRISCIRKFKSDFSSSVIYGDEVEV